MKNKSKKTYLGILIIFLLIIGGSVFYINAILSTGFNIEKPVYIYIDNNRNYTQVVGQITKIAKVKNIGNFNKLASFMKYPQNVKRGCYRIVPGMNIKQAIQLLKSGRQTPVRLSFNNIRLKSDLVQTLSKQLMMKESDLLPLLNDSATCAKYGFTPETIVCMFIPNTYEVYWDITPRSLLQRMDREYHNFWTDARKAEAKKEELTPIQVSILASIVEEECFFTDEYPVVAGLYLNRLKQDQLLQADPTVKFAVGDFTLKRILKVHTEINSPYNTYRNVGLPPGPIRIPSIKAMEAVLNPAKHNYLYMCAKEDFSGRHDFAETHAEHARNASRYHAALNARKIY